MALLHGKGYPFTLSPNFLSSVLMSQALIFDFVFELFASSCATILLLLLPARKTTNSFRPKM